MHYSQNLVGSFIETDRLALKFIWKCTGTKTAKTILENKEVLHYITLRLV